MNTRVRTKYVKDMKGTVRGIGPQDENGDVYLVELDDPKRIPGNDEGYACFAIPRKELIKLDERSIHDMITTGDYTWTVCTDIPFQMGDTESQEEVQIDFIELETPLNSAGIKVRVTVEEEFLKIQVEEDVDVGKDFLPHYSDPNLLGNTITTTEKTLGISEEAHKVLKKVQRGRGSFGDIITCEGLFGWLGDENMLFAIRGLEVNRDFIIPDHIRIPN